MQWENKRIILKLNLKFNENGETYKDVKKDFSILEKDQDRISYREGVILQNLIQ